MQFSKLALGLFSSAALISATPTTTGDVTLYEPALGTCGLISNGNDFVAALNPRDYAGGSACGRHIRVNYQGMSVDVTVVDLCPGCGAGGIALSPAAFQRLAPLDVSHIQASWNFI